MATSASTCAAWNGESIHFFLHYTLILPIDFHLFALVKTSP